MRTMLLIIGVIMLVIAGTIGYFVKSPLEVLGLSTSEFQPYATDVIGTKTGTTTVGVGFSITGAGGQTATSSYVSRISGLGTAVYTIKALAASSSANAVFDVQGSNDDYCNTATTTTSYADVVLTGDINWYSAGDHMKDKTHATSFTNASSTQFLVWNNPMVGVGNEIVLTDLNYECLRLNVSGSSTILWAQIRAK